MNLGESEHQLFQIQKRHVIYARVKSVPAHRPRIELQRIARSHWFHRESIVPR
jgi:hypothetical protein